MSRILYDQVWKHYIYMCKEIKEGLVKYQA